MQNVWDKLPTPFFVLAPMEGVTDTVFRRIVASCAHPDLFMTEFTSVEGYFSDGKARVGESLRFYPEETPIVAQLWGKVADTMQTMTEELSPMGFSGVDINMGCPDRAVLKSGCGGALIQDMELAGSLIAAVKKGAQATHLPVSVKTRIGFNKIETDTWIRFLLEQDLDALTVHGRTVRELSKVPAHWDEISTIVKLRDRVGVRTKIIGNGDVVDAKDALDKYEKYGVDGVMIGRGIFDNLWAFDRSLSGHVASQDELFAIMKRHIALFEKEWGGTKNYATLKKYFKMYIKGFDNAAEIRDRVMQTNTSIEAMKIVNELEAPLKK